MNPFLMMLLTQAAGAVANKIQGQQNPTDLTASYASKYGRDLNGQRSNMFYNMLQPGGQLDAGSWYNMGKAGLGQAGAQTDQAAAMADRSSGNILQKLLQMQPQMQQSAAQTAQGATSRGATSMADLAAEASARARNNMENRFGAGGQFGTTSGGTLAALMHGTAEPLLQAQTAIDQTYGQAYQNALSPMAQGFQSREFNRPQEYQGVAQSYLQGANQALGTGGLLAQLLGGQSEQALIAPQFQSPAQSYGSKLIDVGLGGMSQNLGYAQLQDLLKGLNQTGTPGLGIQSQQSNETIMELIRQLRGSAGNLDLYGISNAGY
jgi:hypothetical protein